MTTSSTPDPEPEARFEGLGLGLGLAAAGALCWFLPGLLGVVGGWLTAGRIAAGVLFIVGSAGSLMELDKERKGFGELSVAVLFAGGGIGLLALATQVIHGLWAGVSAIAGVLVLVFALAGAGLGIGKIASPAGPNGTGTSVAASEQPRKRRFSKAETWTLVLAALQVVLAALALL